MQGGDRVHGVGAADRFGSGLGQADVQDLSLGHQLGQGADGVLDGSVRVYPVLVVEIDAVGTQPPQGALDRGPDVRWAAVERSGASAGVRDEAELRRHHDIVAASLEGAADELLVRVGAVDLGGVDVGDAQLQGSLDGADRLGVAAARVEVVAGHRHRAEPDARDVESAQRNVLHDSEPPVFVEVMALSKARIS